MTDYISREAAYKTLTEYYHHTTDGMHLALKEALSRVPAADVRPVVRGRNIYYERKGDCDFKCSECGAWVGTVMWGQLDGGNFNYCPNCAADMREES